MSLAFLLGSMDVYVTRSGGDWQVPKVICVMSLVKRTAEQATSSGLGEQPAHSASHRSRRGAQVN